MDRLAIIEWQRWGFPGVTKKIYKIAECGEICNSFHLNPCIVKSVEYQKLLFISLGSPLVVLERDIFKLTKGCLMRGKSNLNERVTIRPA